MWRWLWDATWLWTLFAGYGLGMLVEAVSHLVEDRRKWAWVNGFFHQATKELLAEIRRLEAENAELRRSEHVL